MPDGLYDKCTCGTSKPTYLARCRKCASAAKQSEGETPKKCLNCKNHARKGMELCGPCQKVKRGICGKKDCNNQVSVRKGHVFCGLHNGTQKSQDNSGQRNNSQIKCSKCGSFFKPRPAAVKAVKGTVGTGVGGWIGMTAGMALGGFPGLFMLGAAGALGGLATGIDDHTECEKCR